MNSAGIFAPKSLEESTEEDFEGTFDVNVSAVFLAAREAARHMNEGGRITTLAASTVIGCPTRRRVYGASKAAVAGFTRGWTRSRARRDYC